MDPNEVIKAKVLALSAQVLEILRLEQSLPNPETPRECILNEIAARQSIFVEVQSQISNLKTRQNELLPIHLLPMEVLAIILSMAIPLSGHHRRRTSLLLVCRTWTQLINTHPSTFWTTLSTEDPPSQFDRLLRMSRHMPVTIYIDNSSRSANPVSSRKLIEIISSKRLAIRDIVFFGTAGPLVKEVLADWLFAPAPHLRSLSLVVFDGLRVQDRDQVRMDSVAVPCLTSVRLSQVSIPWNAAILRGLRSLCLENLGSPTLEELVGILRHCPNLKYLTLENVFLGPDNRQDSEATRVSLNELMTINLSFPSLQSASVILQCIQYPRTTVVSVKIQTFTPDDDWQVNLGVVLSQITENRIIAAIKLKVDRPHLMLSAANFQFKIPSPNEERENRGPGITYKELFSRLGAPIRTAVTSLHLSAVASQNSTAVLMAANEFLPNLTKLSIPYHERRKSRKPWNVVLETVMQSAEEVNRPVCLCRKLTSLEITTYPRLLDISSIIKFVRIRAADRKWKGKAVEKSYITSIHITLQGANLSAQQTVALNELKGEVTEVHCVEPFAKVATYNDSDVPLESEFSLLNHFLSGSHSLQTLAF